MTTDNRVGAHGPTGAGDLARLSINQQTVRQLSIPQLARCCRALGIPGVGLWRSPVQACGVRRVAQVVRDAGLTVTSLCRGGFFTASDPGQWDAALADNRTAIDEAAALGTNTLVLVSGGLPTGSKDLVAARERVAEALGQLVPYATEHGVRLAIEPLHPMFASDRCVVSTLCQALDLAERFPAEHVGVVVDTYHLWWDEQVPGQLARAGRSGRIAAFQLADWITPLPEGSLLGRGQLGDGCVDLRGFRERVDAVGYSGPVEVEVFNPGLWHRPGMEVLEEVAERYREHVW
ncbi:sugar phosphate isomerase/epimerase family protein [Streptantibioticus rubrisoli]|uniref:Sugar phosphate isomerase/epimerase n=1 Tax=Streptantibioticus rubrisoli TaxID=1387313 RepID=A0ABT1PGT1_9ACTN|nr:sugar phosphate isomerase/epimerase family protein [Streptantibioticus rubrisoli]MCQ4044575.1 sugar phosphate isomerase/epimerase [Streptantibioticus rubrisoli]